MIIIIEIPVFRTLGSQHMGTLLTTYHNGQAHILIMHTLYTHTLCKHSHTQHGHTCVSCSTLTVRSGGGVGDNLLGFIYNKKYIHYVSSSTISTIFITTILQWGRSMATHGNQHVCSLVDNTN